LSAAGGLTLNTSVANTAAIDGSYLLTLINTLSSNMMTLNVPYARFAMQATGLGDFGGTIGTGVLMTTSPGANTTNYVNLSAGRTYINTTGITYSSGRYNIPPGTYDIDIVTSSIMTTINTIQATLAFTPFGSFPGAASILISPTISTSADYNPRALALRGRFTVINSTNYVVTLMSRFNASSGGCVLNATNSDTDIATIQFYKIA